MFIRINLLFLLTAVLSSCGLLPGMQNPNTYSMRLVQIKNSNETFKPVLIPITAALISAQPYSPYVYLVAPADILNITVWQHPEFSTREVLVNQLTDMPTTQGAAGREGYLVNPDGYIYFPLVGKVFVAGKTVDEIRLVITKRLKRYVRRPELNVRIADFRGRKVYVLGEVKKPGFIPLSDQPLTITGALSLMGGIDQTAADPGHIYIIRGNIHSPNVFWLNAKTPEGLLLGEHFNLNPGDILFVSSAPATQWNRVLNQLLPTIQTVWYTQSIINS